MLRISHKKERRKMARLTVLYWTLCSIEAAALAVLFCLI